MDKILLLSYMVLLVGCKTNVKNETEAPELTYKHCLSKEEKAGVLRSILEHKKFQYHLHPKAPGRLPIRLLKSEFISEDLDIVVNEKRVIYDNHFDEKSNVVTIRIDSLDCDLKKIHFFLYYHVEGLVIIGSSQLIDEKWIIKIIRSGEM